MELHLHSKQAMATVEEHREFGKPPPLPKELPLQQLRRNLAELDAIMARLAPKMEPLVQARQAPQAPPAPRPAVVQGLSGVSSRWTPQAVTASRAAPVTRSVLVRGVGGSDVVSDTAAINACGRATEWPRAVQLSEKQMDVDVILFNALLGRLPWHTAAVALVRERELRLRGDTITTNTLLAKVSWHRGLVLLESSGAHRLRRNRITHNTAITIYEKSSMWRLALSKLKGFQADLISFNAAISAGEKGLPLSPVISDCAAISACEKGYRWKQALALPCPSTVGWNAAISACEKDGQWAWALEMLQSMSGARFQRDVISYNGAASACERMAAVEETWEMALCLFQEDVVWQGPRPEPRLQAAPLGLGPMRPTARSQGRIREGRSSTPADAGLEPEDVLGRQINDFIKARFGSQSARASAPLRTVSPCRVVGPVRTRWTITPSGLPPSAPDAASTAPRLRARSTEVRREGSAPTLADPRRTHALRARRAHDALRDRSHPRLASAVRVGAAARSPRRRGDGTSDGARPVRIRVDHALLHWHGQAPDAAVASNPRGSTVRAACLCFVAGRSPCAERRRDFDPRRKGFGLTTRSSQNYQLLLVDGNSGPQAVCELQTDGNTMKLSSLAVRASCRRRGLARRLLRRTVRRAKKLRCQAVQLDVYEDNVPATDLYRSVGFRRFGWTPVVNLELEALLGRTCGRWRLNLLSEEMDADSALADAEAAPTLADLGAELSKRLLYQAEELEDSGLTAAQQAVPMKRMFELLLYGMVQHTVRADCPEDCPARCPQQLEVQSDFVKTQFDIKQFWGVYYEIAYHDSTQPRRWPIRASCQRSVKSQHPGDPKNYKEIQKR
eukprot:g11515.t1